jgi:hypothetical protein
VAKFVVSCTTHCIDFRGLDHTSLTTIHADSAEKAVRAVVVDLLLETDLDRRRDFLNQNGFTELDERVVDGSSITEEMAKLPEEEFKAMRREELGKLVQFEKGDDYEFYCAPVEPWYKSEVYGLQVLEIVKGEIPEDTL